LILADAVFFTKSGVTSVKAAVAKVCQTCKKSFHNEWVLFRKYRDGEFGAAE
jgi:hypothetical protein